MRRFIYLTLIFLTSCTGQEAVYRLVHANDADSCFVTDYSCVQDCPRIELRLIGIDAPEYTQDPWGKRALEYFLEQVKPDTKLYLEDGIEKFDKYGRRLVFLSYQDADKRRRFYNQDLLEQGYAVLFTFDKRQKYLNSFKKAQFHAKTKQFNIWHPDLGLKMSPSQYRRKNRSS